MKLETALERVQSAYKKASANSLVRNPLAYALYQVWKMADAKPTKTTEYAGKCGGCDYAKPTTAFGGSKCYIECTNRPIGRKSSTVAHIKQRTTKACKRYKPKGE